MRAPGMTLSRMPLLVWANLTTSALVVAAARRSSPARSSWCMFDRVMGHALLHRRGRRRRAHVPARLLVLLTSSGLHHDPARASGSSARSSRRSPASRSSATARWRSRRSASACSASRCGRTTCSSPAWQSLAARADDDHDDADRDPDRHQDLLLARRRSGGGVINLRRRDAVRARLHLHVRDRRPVGHLAGRRAVRHPRLQHVLRRRPLPLRAVRRLGVHDLRGPLLLVPEDDRPDVRTSGSASGTSG